MQEAAVKNVISWFAGATNAHDLLQPQQRPILATAMDAIEACGVMALARGAPLLASATMQVTQFPVVGHLTLVSR